MTCRENIHFLSFSNSTLQGYFCPANGNWAIPIRCWLAKKSVPPAQFPIFWFGTFNSEGFWNFGSLAFIPFFYAVFFSDLFNISLLLRICWLKQRIVYNRFVFQYSYFLTAKNRYFINVVVDWTICNRSLMKDCSSLDSVPSASSSGKL